jgi:hypothetical protein
MLILCQIFCAEGEKVGRDGPPDLVSQLQTYWIKTGTVAVKNCSVPQFQ